MKKIFILLSALTVVLSYMIAYAGQSSGKKSGEAMFKEHCAVCHPDGGNIVNPQKTLHKKDRVAHNVKTEADIIKNMRNPGPGMTKFDEKTIPEKDAKEIAEYILKTFK